jgi:ribose/xylose/arabinose/galactoside ABC-type transport system permease subunit
MVRTQSLSRELVLLGVLVALIVVMTIASSLFLTTGNLLNTSRFYVEPGLIALGMTLVIVTGGIDLSVGASLALVSVVMGFAFSEGLPLWLALILALLTGLLCGAFNGFFVTLLDLNPLVVTLGTFALFRGLAFVISDAGAVSQFPSWFEVFGQYYVGPVPLQLFVFILAAVAVGVLLSRGRFGRYVRAIGYNPRAARFSGVPVGRTIVAVYALTGLLVAVAAIIYTSRVSSARADSGLGLELDVIAAVVLGGASIRGGSGTIVGTVLGVLIIAVLRNGLFMAGVPTTWQLIVIGVVLIAAVFVNEFFREDEA